MAGWGISMAPKNENSNDFWFYVAYLGGSAVGVVFFVISLRLAAAGSDPPINILLCFFGGACGWLAGILASPYPNEVRDFSAYYKAVSAFVSGFILAKVDRVFELWTQDSHGVISSVLFFRFLLFATTFAVAGGTIFSGRRFGPWSPLGKSSDSAGTEDAWVAIPPG